MMSLRDFSGSSAGVMPAAANKGRVSSKMRPLDKAMVKLWLEVISEFCQKNRRQRYQQHSKQQYRQLQRIEFVQARMLALLVDSHQQPK